MRAGGRVRRPAINGCVDLVAFESVMCAKSTARVEKIAAGMAPRRMVATATLAVLSTLPLFSSVASFAPPGAFVRRHGCAGGSADSGVATTSTSTTTASWRRNELTFNVNQALEARRARPWGARSGSVLLGAGLVPVERDADEPESVDDANDAASSDTTAGVAGAGESSDASGSGTGERILFQQQVRTVPRTHQSPLCSLAPR